MSVLERYARQLEASGQGVSRKEYEKVTKGMRDEAERLMNKRISTTAEARDAGSKANALLKTADQRDLELSQGLFDAEFLIQDAYVKEQQDKETYAKASAIQNALREESEDRKMLLDQFVAISASYVVGLDAATKRNLISKLLAGEGVEDKHGFYVAFTGGTGDISGRAYMTHDGSFAFVADGGEGDGSANSGN